MNFVSLRDAGDPVELARVYSEQGADEICFLDISASQETRRTLFQIVKQVACEVAVPFTVGGGVRTRDDVRMLLHAGADKVSINSAAVGDPDLIKRLSQVYGSQAIVVAIDAKRDGQRRGKWNVYTHGGRQSTQLDALSWANQVASCGAGEILLTSMDQDGTRDGYDIELIRAVADSVDIPVIASGGVGSLEHLLDGLTKGGADAALAASIFHDGHYSIREAKEFLAREGVIVRPATESLERLDGCEHG